MNDEVTNEAKLINSVCKNKDISVVLTQNVDDLFEGYKNVWESLRNYHKRFGAVPDISVLKDRYPDIEIVEVNGDSKYYLDELRNEFLAARMERIATTMGQKLKTEAPDRILQQVQVEYSKLNRFTTSVRDFDLTDIDRATAHIESVRNRAEAMGGVPGIPTGVKFIDSAYTTGMAAGHLIVSIGWPGKGKTWFASMVAINAFLGGYRPMIFSLEMTPENMMERIYTIMGEGLFSNTAFSRGDINMDDFRAFAKQHLQERDGFIVTGPDGVNDVTPNIIQGKIEQYRPDFVALDYAQLFSDNRKTDAMTPRMMNFSRECKSLAVTNQIPLLLITAATAEENSDVNDPPTLHKVAWSKSIEYDADHAWAVQYNDESGLVEIVGRKNRHGILYSGFLEWDLDRGIVKERFDL
jgi:replicative DNA helicase